MKCSILSIALAIFSILYSDIAEAQQITRRQLGQKFYQATQYHNSGKDSLAISLLEEIAELMPNFALTYRREAEIYDDMSKKGDALALNGAVLMYRKYLTLELDASKAADIQKRLRELEDKLNVEHFEDSQKVQAIEEQKQNVVLASLDDGDDDFDGFVMKISHRTKTSIARSKPVSLAHKTEEKTEPEKNVEDKKEIIVEAKPEEKTSVKEGNTNTPVIEKKKDYSKFSYIDYFNLNIPKNAIAASQASKNLESKDILGHWVSSETNPSGREYWIFDVSPFSSTFNVTLSDAAGVVSPDEEDENIGERLMKILRSQNILGHTTQMDIDDRMTTGALNSNHFTFTIEGKREYVPNSNLYNWTNQIIANISPVIPFGSIIAKIGETVTNNLSTKDEAAKYKITMHFDCWLESDGVLQCAMQKRTTRSAASGTKTRTEMKTFALYRTNSSYSHFSPEILDTDESNEIAIMQQAKEKVQTDNNAAYALALLYHYGIGDEKDDKEAVSYMTLATQSNMAPKAMSWLAKFYNEEAESASSLSFFTRRKYRNMSSRWLEKMKQQNMPEYYGTMGDILSEDPDKERQDSALFYFQKGALAGDAYSCYRYGQAENQKGNYIEATDKLLLAGKKGFADAYCDIAVMKREGKGAPADYNEYLKYITLALDNGSSNALKELADAYLMGYGVNKDFVQGNVIRSYWYQSVQNQWLDDLYLLGFDIDQLK